MSEECSTLNCKPVDMTDEQLDAALSHVRAALGITASGESDADLVEYRPCHINDQYRIGSDGSVWTSINKERKWVERKQQRSTRGYMHVKVPLGEAGSSRMVSTHRLVLEAFVGPCPQGCVCAHRNGKKTDNRLSNLRWATPAENEADKIMHGTSSRRGWYKHGQ